MRQFSQLNLFRTRKETMRFLWTWVQSAEKLQKCAEEAETGEKQNTSWKLKVENASKKSKDVKGQLKARKKTLAKLNVTKW